MPITGFSISEGQDTGEAQQLEETCAPLYLGHRDSVALKYILE